MILMQPWATLVAEGAFPVLVRSMNTNYRGRVKLVARGWDVHATIDTMVARKEESPRPAIIGSVEIADCIAVPKIEVMRLLEQKYGKEFATFYPKHFIPDSAFAYFWLLRRPKILKMPTRLDPHRARVWIRF